MFTEDYPSHPMYCPSKITWGIAANNRVSKSSLNGSVQTIGLPGSYFTAGFILPARGIDFIAKKEARERAAFFLGLNGQENRVRFYDLQQPVPIGTINLSGVTLGAAAAQFAGQVVLTGCGAGKTLAALDAFSIGSQYFRARLPAVADGSGNMTVKLVIPLRNALPAGQVVILSRPRFNCILTVNELGATFGVDGAEALGIDLREIF
jgi:hypothetical protein